METLKRSCQTCVISTLLLSAVVFINGCDRSNHASTESSMRVDQSKLATPSDEIVGLPNFAKVSNKLYRGAQPERQGFIQLDKMGVKTVINLRTSSSDAEAIQGLKLDYVEISVDTHDLEDEHVIAFLKVARDPVRQPAFVHCKHGADRTGTMVAMYRMVEQGWNREEAMAELDRFGFHSIWANLKRYLRQVDVEAIRGKVGR